MMLENTTRTTVSRELVKRIRQLSKLPYKKGEYASRHWGHKRHQLCSYPSKLTPSIAYYLVNQFSEKGQTILDPLAGSGTIPFEACLNGRLGIGSDLSPLAYHITNAKVHKHDEENVREEIENLSDYIKNYELDKVLISEIDDEIKEFFHKRTLEEILKAKIYLDNFKDSPLRSLLVASISHVLHGNRPYALSRRSHNIIPIPPKGKFKYKPLINSLTAKIKRTLKHTLPTDFCEGKAYQENILDFTPEKEIDVIITSPPFLGTTEFLRQNRVRLWFNGWDYEKQEKMKEQFLEYKRLEIYEDIFPRFYTLLKKEAICVLHMGVVGSRDMAKELTPMAEDSGLRKRGIVYEDTSKMESQGRTDRGNTKKHQFLILQKM